MSIRVMTWVWNESRSKKNARLLLLAIADCAADDGANAYPSITELIRKTGLSERGVQSTLVDLVALGELRVYRNAGPGGCNRYRVVMSPADPAPPQDLPPQKTAATPADPAPVTVLEPPKKKISSSKRPSSGTRGTRLPDGFEPNAEMVEWARANTPGVSRSEHARFCDHFRAAAGQRGVKLDWVATWRNWMRTAQERIDERSGRTPGAKPSTSDARVAAVLALKETLPDQQRSLPA